MIRNIPGLSPGALTLDVLHMHDGTVAHEDDVVGVKLACLLRSQTAAAAEDRRHASPENIPSVRLPGESVYPVDDVVGHRPLPAGVRMGPDFVLPDNVTKYIDAETNITSDRYD